MITYGHYFEDDKYYDVSSDPQGEVKQVLKRCDTVRGILQQVLQDKSHNVNCEKCSTVLSEKSKSVLYVLNTVLCCRRNLTMEQCYWRSLTIVHCAQSVLSEKSYKY